MAENHYQYSQTRLLLYILLGSRYAQTLHVRATPFLRPHDCGLASRHRKPNQTAVLSEAVKVKSINQAPSVRISRLLSGMCFFGFLGPYYITMKPPKYILYPQGLLNSLDNDFSLKQIYSPEHAQHLSLGDKLVEGVRCLRCQADTRGGTRGPLFHVLLGGPEYLSVASELMT